MLFLIDSINVQTCRNLFFVWIVARFFCSFCEKVLPLQMKLDVFQMKLDVFR